MSTFEASIKKPKKQLEFYKQLTEQLQQENYQLKIQISAREEEYRKLEREFQELKLINKEYERLNKENGRGFKIISVKQYNIDELVKCEDNWNKLKEWVNKHYDYYMNNEDYIGGRLCFTDMKDKMQELERGVSDVED